MTSAVMTSAVMASAVMASAVMASATNVLSVPAEPDSTYQCLKGGWVQRIPLSISILALALTVLAGCGETGEVYYPVSGKVVFEDGSPARFGSIESRSELGAHVIARGRIASDGVFRLKSMGGKGGLVAGSHQLVIVQVIGSPRGGGSIIHNHGHETADKYRSYDSSDLKIDVRPGEDNFFELTVEAKPKD